MEQKGCKRKYSDEDHERADQSAKHIAGNDAKVADKAFEDLFRWLGPDIYRYIRRLGLPEVDAKDVVHNVFFGIWENRSKFGKPGTIYRIYKIARNKFYDWLRDLYRQGGNIPSLDRGVSWPGEESADDT